MTKYTLYFSIGLVLLIGGLFLTGCSSQQNCSGFLSTVTVTPPSAKDLPPLPPPAC
jgi:hypothetical protein